NAFHFIAALYASLIVLGSCTNSLIIIATIRTKTLHSTCSILIAFCALSDILHQFGHLPKIIPILFLRDSYICSFTCSIIQIIPNFGLSAGVILLLLIAIDRLLSVHFSPLTINKHSHAIMMCHTIAILTYASIQYYLAYRYFEERNVICSPPSMHQGFAFELWGMLTLSVILLSVTIYFAVWKELEHSGVRANLLHTKRVFRSVIAVMCTLILGWLLTMTIVMVNRFVLDLQGSAKIIGTEVAGMPANIALTLNCFVLYSTSVEYRRAFRRQLRAVPLIARLFQDKKVLTLSLETT
ncbi:hypothetical protein PMAYCL1PPCAC_17154, partial [Pristionchus mayeri]